MKKKLLNFKWRMFFFCLHFLHLGAGMGIFIINAKNTGVS